MKYNNADNDNSAIDTSWYDYKNDQRDCIITVKMIMITVLYKKKMVLMITVLSMVL